MAMSTRMLLLSSIFTICSAAVLLAAGEAPASSVTEPKGLVRTEPAAQAELQKTAAELIAYLQRMIGKNAIPAEAGKIVLALVADATQLAPEDKAKLQRMNREAYMLRAQGGSILIAGRTPLAVQHGMFDYLERLGFRWLIPSERWTITPKRTTWQLDGVHVFREPLFFSRRIWYSYGYGVDASKNTLKRDYALWHRANRLGGLAGFNCGHSYPHTVGAYKDVFKEHPEYFAMDKNGKRMPFNTYQSLCYSNPDVAKIFIAHRLKELKAKREKNPHHFMVSMDPNDGSSPCYCKSCQALGNGSDQALYLANQVAKALRQEVPDAAVGMYIYASHRLPPTKVRAEPNVYMQLAMAFNKSGLSYEELARGWRKAGVGGLGIRDYYGVMVWDMGLPGRGRGSSLAYMRRSIPQYKAWGATSISAECNANWGTFGPAIYVASRLMWDKHADADEIYADYFRSAFGKAAKPMQTLHSMWAEYNKLSRSNMHQWFTQLNQALQLAQDEEAGVKQRLEDMVAYMHYVVLSRHWEAACRTKDKEKAYAALKPLLRFTWRIRTRQVMHAYALQRRLVNAGAPILRPLKQGWRFNDKKAVWKDATPVTGEELARIFKQDLADHPADDRLVAFSRNLVPLNLEQVKMKPAPAGSLRNDSKWHLLVDKAPEELALRITKGRLRSLELQDPKGKTLLQREWRRGDPFEDVIMLKVSSPGLHALILRGRGYRPAFPRGVRAVCEASERHPFPAEMLGGYVYVPKGVETILATPGMRLSLKAPSWPKRRDFFPKDAGKRGCLEIPVGPDGGAFWQVIGQTRGAFCFYNIPPYVALEPEQALVPAEVRAASVAHSGSSADAAATK